MEYRIEISDAAVKDLAGLQSQDRGRVLRFLRDWLQSAENPRALGQALKGSRLCELWRYRVGDFRIIARIEDVELLILVLRIGHRREIYR